MLQSFPVNCIIKFKYFNTLLDLKRINCAIFNNNLNTIIMRLRYFFISLVCVLASGLFLNSCSNNDDAALPTIIFNQTEGKANVLGEYTVSGRIQSEVALSKVIITKEGSSTPFLVDDSTAKNKNDYYFSYLITGVTANTYIVVDIYNQANDKTTVRFLIRP